MFSNITRSRIVAIPMAADTKGAILGDPPASAERHKLSFIRLCEELVKEDHATYIAGAKRPRTRLTA